MGKNDPEALAVFLSPGTVDRSGYDSARSLARNCLRSACSLDGVRTFVYTDPRHEDWARELVPEDPAVEVRLRGPHARERFSEKVENVFSSLFDEGYRRVVAVAADTPHLTPTVLRSAFSRLLCDESRAVVGPSRDGGFYLLGLKSPQGNFLGDVTFYRSDTREQLTQVLRRSMDRVLTLRLLEDVDVLSDWLKFSRGWILTNLTWYPDVLRFPEGWNFEPAAGPPSSRSDVLHGRISRAPPAAA